MSSSGAPTTSAAAPVRIAHKFCPWNALLICFKDEFCQRENSPMTTQASARADLDYDLNDGFCSESETSLQDTRKQHQFGEVPSPVANLASRLSQRLPSFSRKLKDRSPTTSVNRQGIRSAPISRTPSFRMPSLTKSLATHLETRGPYTPPDTPVDAVHDDQLPEPAPPVDIALPTRMEDPIDRQALASTPLLPPTMMDRRGSDAESMQSPLQSPTIADSATFSFIASPSSTPAMQSAQTPPLSSKPSNSSIGMVRSSQLLPSADIPSVALSNAEDKWAAKLGHANFDIFPEPYLPESHDTSSFKRLTEDWESARKQYMKHAVYTSDNYGPTSQTYKHTEQKWAAIDAQWKRNHEIVASRAAANGESAVFQPLAEPAALAKIPSIDGPESEGKFPTLENAQIVGPMVQYAKVHRQRPRRSTIMKFFSDLRLTSPPSRPRSSSR